MCYRFGIAAASLLAITTCTDVFAAASFQGLGDLPGGITSSNAFALSADGLVVAGSSWSTSGNEAFRWTSGGGMVGLGDLPGGGFSSNVTAVSADGSVMVGRSESGSGPEAFRWTAGGMVGLGDLAGSSFASSANGVSADGSVVVGTGSSSLGASEAFTWISGGGMVGLGDLSSGPFKSDGTDISADGLVVVGQSTIEIFPNDPPETFRSRAFRWTQADGMVDLGSPAPGLHTLAQAVSADGSVIVGNTYDGLGLTMPFRWTEGSGIVLLDEPLGGDDLARPIDVSANGLAIVGQTFTNNGPEAVLWDHTNSVRYLQDILVNDLGLDLTGWTLASANAISDDGLTIVGWGTNPNGDEEAFIATLPEPGTVALIALGLPALIRRR